MKFPLLLPAFAKVAISLLVLPLTAFAHQPGNSSLVLQSTGDGILKGEYHVADVDLESIRLMLEDRAARLGGTETPGNVAGSAVADLDWIAISVEGNRLDLDTGPAVPVDREGRLHTMIPFTAELGSGDLLEVTFNDFFAFDPQHRVVTSLETDGETKVGLLTLDQPSWTTSLSAPGALGQFVKFTWEGVWHIWIGIDHILFLVALLLPSVVRFENGKWRPVESFKEAFYTVLKVVTAFTIAHSVTLSLAALDIVSLPSKFVESVIAFSVALAALNNIFPLVRSERIWTVAFIFGLIHGFGFANVLADLQLPSGVLAIALLSFNIGVELGQMAIVAVFFPIIFYLRSHSLYLPVKLRLGSALIALVACAWMVDRIFELEMMPF